MSGIDSAVACGLKANGARLAVTVTKAEFDVIKAAIGYQTTDSGTGRVWMGIILLVFICKDNSLALISVPENNNVEFEKIRLLSNC